MAIEVDFRANLTDAQRAMVNFYALQEKVDQEFKETAKSAREAEKAAARAFQSSQKGAKDAKTEVAGVKNETTGFEKAAGAAASQVRNWIGGFIGLSGIVRMVKSVVAELKEAQRVQSEMLGKAVDIDRMAQGLAALKPGGLTPANVAASRSEIQNLALQTSTDLETARQSLFFGYSAYSDNPAGARGAALTTAKVSATGQLKPEQIAALPGLFKVLGANTEAEQIAATTKLVAATKGSIAETAPFIPEFVQAYPQLKAAGFSYDEALSMMVSSVTASAGNVSEAGTRMQSAVKYTAYPSNEAEKYLSGKAKKMGMDFSKMQPRERFFLTRDIYQQALEDKTITEFGSAFGTKAMQGFGGLFTPQSQAEYERALAGQQTADMGMLQKDFAGYLQTLPARQATEEAQFAISQAQTGREKEQIVRFSRLVDEIRKQTKAGGEYGERMAMIAMPESMERANVAIQLAQMGLQSEMMKLETGGVSNEEIQQYKKLKNLSMIRPSADFSLDPGWVESVMAETDSFTNIKAGADYGQNFAFQKSIERTLGLTEETAKKLNENLQLLNQNIERQTQQAAVQAQPPVFD